MDGEGSGEVVGHHGAHRGEEEHHEEHHEAGVALAATEVDGEGQEEADLGREEPLEAASGAAVVDTELAKPCTTPLSAALRHLVPPVHIALPSVMS